MIKISIRKLLFCFIVLMLLQGFDYLPSDKPTDTFNDFAYPGGKYKALIMSFDDGCVADIKLAALFDKYKIIGTFNISSDPIGTTQIWSIKNGDTIRQSYVSEETILKIYKNHEIAAHGATHKNFLKISKDEILDQINVDIQKLNLLTRRKITSMAYPFGAANDSVSKIVAGTAITNARTVKSTNNFELPQNLLIWNPTCRDDKALNFLDNYLKSKEKKLSVFYVWGHSWELGNGKRWGNMVEFCKSISNQKDIWYTGSGTLAHYINATKKVKIKDNIITNPKGNLTVWLNLSSGVTKLKPGHQIELKML